METSLQVIDSFIDGERVDPNALKAALAEPAGRDYFVDVWLLREAVQREGAADAAPPSGVTAGGPRREPRRWMVAAAIAGALIGGYAIGYGTTGRATAPTVAAPTPAITVSAPSATTAFPVPPATRVIQLEFHPATTAGGD